MRKVLLSKGKTSKTETSKKYQLFFVYFGCEFSLVARKMPDTRTTKSTESPAPTGNKLINKFVKANNSVAPTLADFTTTIKELCQQVKQMADKQSDFETKLTSTINLVGDSIDQQISSLCDDLRSEFSVRIHKNEEDIWDLQEKNQQLTATCAALTSQLKELRNDSSRHDEQFSELSDQIEW